MAIKTNIFPIILAGGFGTRLWPLSRKSYPKQFTNLLDGTSPFQEAALRLSSSNIVELSSHIILTNDQYHYIVTQQLETVGIDPGSIIIEPEAKNTAPAILSACLLAFKKDKNAILLVNPSDHFIPDINKFHELIKISINSVQKNNIITFGITPTRAETGYGYLELPGEIKGGISKISNFIEKPNISDAKEMFKSKKFLWNSGIFMFRAEDMITEFQKHQAKMLDLVKRSFEQAETHSGFTRLEHTAWSAIENISIDYAIFEKAKNLMVVPFSGYWSDLGDWKTIFEHNNKNFKENELPKNIHTINCKNTFLRSENPRQQIVGLGLNNIVAIAMDDAVLVTDKNNTQYVNDIVKLLKSKKIDQAENHLKDFRPWGWYENILILEYCKVKSLCVLPGASLSLQSHQYRSENWIVVKGKAEVIVGDKEIILGKGETTYIPAGTIHGLKNPTKKITMIIEVQTGTYFGEDDITRYEDLYNRQ